MKIDNNLLGEIIKDRRKDMKMSQKELAAKMGVQQSYISELEKGKKGNPTTATLLKLADSLNIYWDELMLALSSEEEKAEIIREQNALYEVDENDMGLMAKIKRLTPEQRKLVESVVDSLLDQLLRGE